MIVEVKQLPDQSATSIGLDKHNRSKLPGTFDMMQPAKGQDGRWITGIDEESGYINAIQDKEEKARLKKQTLELRLKLEEITNVNLKATNDEFWSKYVVILKDNFSLNLDIPFDKLKYYVLISNGYAAPEYGVTGSPEYINTKYYISRKEEEVADKMTTKKAKDKARAKLLELSENKKRLFVIAQYLLGDRVKEQMSEDTLYSEVSNFIDDKKEAGNVKLFLDAVSKDISAIQYKIIVDKAIKKNIIRIRDGYYQRGNATYGKNVKEVLDYLSNIENANEFASLKEEVDEP